MKMNFIIFQKTNIFILALSVFISVISSSCNISKSNDYEVAFDTIHVSKTESIDYKKSKLNCNLNISFVYPVACNEASLLRDLQKIFIERIFPPEYSNLSPQEAVDNFVTQYISNYKSIKAEDFFEDDYILEDENDFIYELFLENEIIYNKNNLISFIVKNINYEGGANSSNSIYGYVIDLNTGKFLAENDFAGDNYNENLSFLIVQKIAESKELNNILQLEDIGYYAIENIIPNDNFVIDDKGITYYFNEDDIAAGFIGITEVFISYEELKNFIVKGNPVYSLAGF